MGQAKSGDTVVVNYTGKLDDGKVFDTSIGRDPLQFTIGDGKVIQGFEDAVIGMSPGESKTFKILADNAYGQRHKKMILPVDRKRFPENTTPEIGQSFQVNQPDGRIITFTVIDVTEALVTLDANHPLAGKDLNFDIQLVKIA